MKQKGFTPILILLIVVAIGVIGYFGYKNYQKFQISSNSPLNSSTPRPQINDEMKSGKLGDIEFAVSKNYYLEYSKNIYFPIETYGIDPNFNLNVKEKVPTFLFRLDMEKVTLDEKEKSLIATWHLLDVVEKSTTIAGKDGIIFTARVNPVNNYNSRFKDNAKVKFGLFVIGNNVYHLLGDISKEGDEQIFDQILSTFKFTNTETQKLDWKQKINACVDDKSYLFPVLSKILQSDESKPISLNLEVTDTERGCLTLPTDLYPPENRKFTQVGSSGMGYVSNWEEACKGVHIQRIDDCSGDGYQASAGNGKVLFSAKSSVAGVPDINVEFTIDEI